MRSRRSASSVTPGVVRAVVYCRVSTKEQTQNFSLATQQKTCEGYCAQHGIEVARVFVEEGESAKTLNRPQLSALLDYCREAGRVQHVVVYKLDRLSRRQFDYLTLGALLNRFGVTVRSATEHITQDFMGRFVESLLAGLAQLDNDARADRTITGMKAALGAGRWTFGVPLGYRRTTDTSGRVTIEPDPDTAPLVKTAFELYAKGTETKAEVLRRVNAMGLRTRKGCSLSMQTFEAMLRKPLYAGLMTMTKWGIDRVAGSFEAIVAVELFDTVQAVLDGRRVSVTPHTRNHPDFPLRRFVRCATCTTPLTGSPSRGRGGVRYPYYRCRNRQCLAVKVPKVKFEQQFMDLLGGLRPRPEYFRLFREIVLDVWRQKQSETKITTITLARRIDDLEERRQKLLETYTYRKTIADDLYRREDDRLAQEIALARSELHDAQLDELDIEGVLAFAEHVIMDAGRLWLEGTLDQRQRFQQALFPKGIPYDQASGFGTAETSLFFTWLQAIPRENCEQVSPTGFGLYYGSHSAWFSPLRKPHDARTRRRGADARPSRRAGAIATKGPATVRKVWRLHAEARRSNAR